MKWPKWISVEERLPKPGKDVWIYFRSFSGPSACFVVEFQGVGWLTIDTGTWQLNGANGVPETTHWLPLPPPPKKRGDK